MMEQAVENASKIRTLYENLTFLSETAPEKEGDREFVNRVTALKEEFMESMRQDFNTATALASLYEFVKTVNAYLEKHTPSRDDVLKVGAFLGDMCRVLGLLEERGETFGHETELLKLLLDVRRELRRRGIYDLSDRIRAGLAEIGVVVEDVKGGERVRVVR
jgi:cysteinyl-tRNA synthetase